MPETISINEFKKLKLKKSKASKLNPKDKIEFILIGLKIDFVKEYQFDENRKFRFDFAIKEHRIAIEYEGIYQTEKSGHTNVKGYTKDCCKYNLAIINGWRVLRYTADNANDVLSDLKRLITIA